METDQQGLPADEEEEEEEASCKKQKIFVDKVKSTIPFQPTNHKAHSSNSTNSISVAAEISKEIDGKMPFIREIPFHEKRPLFGNEWQNMGIYHSVSKDPFGQKEEFLGTEESQDFSSNMHKFQRKEPLVCIESSFKETSCLMSNVHGGTESSDECNTSTSNRKTKISLIGVRKQKNGRYGAVIRDTIRRKQVWLGTFDTIEEASQAYFSKKLELENEKLNQQGKKVNKANENCDQTQPPESPVVVASLSVANIASVGIRNERLELKTTTHIVGVHKSNKSEKEPELSKETSCLMANVRGTESSNECNTSTSCNPKVKISLLGIRRQKNGKYGAVIRDTIRHKQVWLGTFDTIEEASQAYFSKKSELENEKLNLQGNKEYRPNMNPDPVQQPKSPIVPSLSVADDQTVETASVDSRNKRTDSHEAVVDIIGVRKNKTSGKEPESSTDPACLMANVDGTESSYECNTSTTCNPKGKRSLLGIRRQKNGRYGAVITDQIKHKKVWLGTFGTVEEASQAYLSKKSELKKLGQQENKPKKNCDQVQQPESSPVAASFSNMANDQTLDIASERGRDKRIDSHKTTTHIIGANKSKTAGKYTSEITNPITKKKIWLGTFGTAEEASRAYHSKKLEFQRLVKAKQQQCTDKKTHSKQDAGEEKVINVKQGHENVNCEPFLPESPIVTSLSVANHDQTSKSPRVSRRNKTVDSQKTTHIVGVYKRKTGKYSSEIRNPINKKRIWLGTFGTAEEASQAYQSKKLEFQKLVNAKQKCSNKQTHSKQDAGEEKLVTVKQGHENVNCELKSAGGPEIDVPISNSSNEGTDQMFDTAEEAFHAYQSKKFDLQSSKEVELQSDVPTDSSTREKQEGQEDDNDLWMGEWVQLPGNTAVKFSLKLGLPIIDNYGSLLGEFSTLDDLSICKTEDGNET
ncbi:uncharacterized protein LOC132030598 [Lycium ferocissimum]|uniref:uncharacterized protein LOC132030598 n=1 Tax=Lycium ferocissimum TaxID=112874 RepID=UPI0028163B20|nr:uncharacterized protein LOC132030598 [Lycium ferocissimum]